MAARRDPLSVLSSLREGGFLPESRKTGIRGGMSSVGRQIGHRGRIPHAVDKQASIYGGKGAAQAHLHTHRSSAGRSQLGTATAAPRLDPATLTIVT